MLDNCKELTEWLWKHTIEVRVPFLDKNVVETAMKISGNLKIKRENHQITTKYILRKLAANFCRIILLGGIKSPSVMERE